MDNPIIKTEKLLKYGKKQLTDKGVDTQATTIREVLDDIGNVTASEPTQYGAYNIEVIHKDDGTQELHITDAVEKPVNFLQWKCDNSKSLTYAFAHLGYGTIKTLIEILNGVDTSNVTDMSCAFYKITSHETLDLTSLDTSNVTTMKEMFAFSRPRVLDCSSFNTSNVTTMEDMFYYCEYVTDLDLSNFDTKNVTNMNAMFQQLSNVLNVDVSSFDTSNVTNMGNMFAGCWKLETLNLSNFNTSKVTSMFGLVQNCKALSSVDLSGFDTSNVTSIGSMFSNCTSLITILGTLDLIKTSGTTNMFYNCAALTTVTLKNIKPNLQIGSGTSYGHLLTLDTLINTIKELWDYSGGSTTYKLTIGSANLEKITNTYVKLITPTEEQIAADPNITSKLPCVVCDSTEEGAMLISEYAYLKMWSIV